LAIFSYPITGILSEAYDENGDGHISTTELVESAKLAIRMRKSNSKLWKALGSTIFLVAVLVLSTAGLTYGIIDANKDTKFAGRSLLVKSGEGAEVPVAVSTNEVSVPPWEHCPSCQRALCWSPRRDGTGRG